MGLPVLAPGDEIRLDGNSYRVVALDGTAVRLVDVTGAATAMRIGHLMADASFELVTGSRPRLSGQATIEQLPQEARARAQWWEQHLVGCSPVSRPTPAPGTVARPELDPARYSLRQRELAKHAALTAAGHGVGLSTLKRLRRRYERDGLWGLVDQRHARAARGRAPEGAPTRG